MSLLLRRGSLLMSRKKSSNLFNESLLLSSANCVKVENGYQFSRYPVGYTLYQYPDQPLVNYIKSVLKPDTDYTLAYNVTSRNESSVAGRLAIRNSDSSMFLLEYGTGKRIGTFRFSQEQIDSIYAVYIWGTTQEHTDNGAKTTIITEFQLLEGSYTLDTLPPYEPF